MPVPASTLATTAADTAAVLEFRCLFSRDGHKKRKTFHDGTLKFHAFNARVMVYDLDRHYVGDLHYRHDDDFDEGLELRLDSGVVVQVQDRLGQTLTPLDQPLRPNPAVSQQRPRSLKDVLAASQRATCCPRVPVLTPGRQKAPRDLPPARRRRAVLRRRAAAAQQTPKADASPTASATSSKAAIGLPQIPLMPTPTEAASQIDVQCPVSPVETVAASFATALSPFTSRTAVFTPFTKSPASARRANHLFKESTPSSSCVQGRCFIRQPFLCSSYLGENDIRLGTCL
ncbi:hypothetical protein DV736_g4143, partial [Chaetothyriales sp. CBS 134916]